MKNVEYGKPLKQNKDFDLRDIVKPVVKVERIKRTISPSSGGGYCSKQSVSNVLTPFKGNDAESVAMTFNFSYGKFIETFLMSVIKSNVVAYNKKLPPNNELKFTGEFDFLVSDNAGKFRILEIKTSSELPSKKNEGSKLYRPYYYHQLLCYMTVYCCDGSLVYFNRNEKTVDWQTDELQYLIHNYKFDYQESWDVVYRLAESAWLIKNNIIPKKPTHIQKKAHCGFCRYDNVCWDNDSGQDVPEECVDYATNYANNYFISSEVEQRRYDLYTQIKHETHLTLEEFMKGFE